MRQVALLKTPFVLVLFQLVSESQWSATEAESIDAKRATLAVLARAGRFDRLTEMWRQSTLWPPSSSSLSSSQSSQQQARVWSEAREAIMATKK
jgi:hypothetical protein